MNAREIIERERRKLSLPECEHGWVDQEFLSPVVYDTCPHCRIKELSAAAERVIERLKSERDALRGLDAAHNDEYRELRAEVERLRALLRECEPHINEHYDDGADLCKRIRAAFGEGE